MISKPAQIAQAIYDLLKPVISDRLYVMRLRGFDPEEVPFSNILLVRGEPPKDMQSETERMIEFHILSVVSSPEAFAQAEERRKLIHDALMSNRGLDGLVVRIVEGAWEYAPDTDDDGLLKIIQQYHIRYRGSRDAL